MPKGRKRDKGGAAANAEAFRALERRKRAETVADLGKDILDAAFGYFMIHDEPDGPPGEADDARDGVDGGTVTFGPGKFPVAVERDDPADDEVDPFDDTVPDRVLDHPLADEVLAEAMPTLVDRMGLLAQPFVGSVLDQAAYMAGSIHRDRLVGEDEEIPHGARGFEAEMFAIPFAGPAGAVAEALGAALAGGAFEAALVRTGAVAPGSRLATYPTPVPLDGLCRLGVQAVRSATRQPCLRWMGAWRVPEPDMAALGTALGGVGADAFAGMGGFVSGAVLGLRMVPRNDVDADWLGGREPADGEPDPEAAWEAWGDAAFSGTGMAVGIPGNVGNSPSEAAALLVETRVQADNVSLDMEPDAYPDRVVVLEDGEAMTLLMLHDRRRRIVGPVTLPIVAVDRDCGCMDDTISIIGGTKEVYLDDRAEFDRILADAVAARDAPRGPGVDHPAAMVPSPVEAGPARTADVIPLRPRAVP